MERNLPCDKTRGELVNGHLETAHGIGRGYNSDTLGLARQIIPQLDKDNNIKGASFIFITNGATRPTLEMISNLQALSNATQRLIYARGDCSSISFPPYTGQSGETYIGKASMRRILIKTDPNPVQGCATLAHHAAFMTT